MLAVPQPGSWIRNGSPGASSGPRNHPRAAPEIVSQQGFHNDRTEPRTTPRCRESSGWRHDHRRRPDRGPDTSGEVAGKLVVESAGADLEQEVGAVVPAHLLFLTVRLLMTWLTADSVDAVQMASPTLSRSPFRRSGTGRRRGPAGITKTPAPCRGPHGHQASPPAGQLRQAGAAAPPARRPAPGGQGRHGERGRAVTAATAVVVVM